MKTKSVDPSGHLTLAVSDFRKSKRFYTELFEWLGFKQISGAAWVTQAGFGIWVRKARYSKPRYTFFAPGIHHLCFKTETKRKVDEVYRRLTAKRVPIFDAPKLYPEYTSKYYAVFFADPDGIKIEVAYY